MQHFSTKSPKLCQLGHKNTGTWGMTCTRQLQKFLRHFIQTVFFKIITVTSFLSKEEPT